jgi:type IV secretory pathway VirB2 component (pilin)
MPVPPPNMWLSNLQAMITLGNVILLLCLLFIYAKSYGQIKSKFALGLIAFVILLIVQAFTSIPFVHLLWGFRSIHALGLLTIVSDWFEFVALLILLYISLKPE